MDFLNVAQSLGIPVATASFFVWWLKNALSDRITVLEKINAERSVELASLNKYIREEQAALIAEAHLREREFVSIIRDVKTTSLSQQETTEIIKSRIDRPRSGR